MQVVSVAGAFSKHSSEATNLSTPLTRNHTNSYKRLTLPDGTLVMIPILCNQEHLSCVWYHDELSRQIWKFIRHPVGCRCHIFRSALRRLCTRVRKSIPVYPAFTG